MFYQNLYNLYVSKTSTQTWSLTAVCQANFQPQIAEFIVMTQILDSLPADCANRILCCYINDTHKIKITRITNISNWYSERVVFPGEKLLFEALPEARLEIYVTNFSTVALVEINTCDRLAVKNLEAQQNCIAQYS